jgi:predicted aspartyl protease
MMTSLVQRLDRLSALAALGFLACGVQAGTPANAPPEHVQGAADRSQRLTVPVRINGGGPYHFVVDTGAERTVISRELAERLTLARSDPVTLLSVTGFDQVETAEVAELRLGSSRTSMDDFEAPMLSAYNLGAAGMLGIDSLQNKRVVLDFHEMRMSISDARHAAARDSDEIVVTARRRLGQLILVDADADGEKISVIIDTGSEVSIGNPRLRQELMERGRLGTPIPIRITSVTGGQTPAEYMQVHSVRIGGITLKNMPVAFADPQIFRRLGLDRKPAMLLGMDTLRLFDRVSIDFANRNVRFILKGSALQGVRPQLASRLGLRRG